MNARGCLLDSWGCKHQELQPLDAGVHLNQTWCISWEVPPTLSELVHKSTLVDLNIHRPQVVSGTVRCLCTTSPFPKARH